MKPAALSREELVRLLKVDFPQIFRTQGYVIEDIRYGGCRVRRSFHDDLLRPGGTVSGPTLMEMGDFAMYVAVLASIGWKPLAVTTNLTVNFLRKPAQRDLIADCQLLKIGKRLAVGEATIRSEGEDEPVAHITATYSIPVG